VAMLSGRQGSGNSAAIVGTAKIDKIVYAVHAKTNKVSSLEVPSSQTPRGAVFKSNTVRPVYVMIEQTNTLPRWCMTYIVAKDSWIGCWKRNRVIEMSPTHIVQNSQAQQLSLSTRLGLPSDPSA